MSSTPRTFPGGSCALRKGGISRSWSSLGSGLMRRNSQRGQLGSQQKPAFKPPSRGPIPDVSNLPPFQEQHARLQSKLWRSRSTTDLSTPGRKTGIDRHASCKAPRSNPEETCGRPAWDDRTQVNYPRLGFEIMFDRLWNTKKKAKTGKKQKVKKVLAEGGVKGKEKSKGTPEPRRRVVRFSSVPDLTFLSAEKSPEAPHKTAEGGEAGEKESVVEWFLERMRNWQPRTVAKENQGITDMCKSLEVLPLPKEDSGPCQVAKRDTPKPEPQCSSKGLFSKATKKAGPGKPSQLEVVHHERGELHLKWHSPADHRGRPVLRYIVEQKLEHSANWVESLKTSGAECEATVTGLPENCRVQFRVRAVDKANVGEPSDPVDSRPVAAQGARPKEWRKVATPAKERHLTARRFSPRPNRQPNEVENKAPVKRNILSSLSNITRPDEKATKLGGSRLRRAASKLDVAAADTRRQAKAPSTIKKAAQGASAPSTDKENGREGAVYHLRSARAIQ